MRRAWGHLLEHDTLLLGIGGGPFTLERFVGLPSIGMLTGRLLRHGRAAGTVDHGVDLEPLVVGALASAATSECLESGINLQGGFLTVLEGAHESAMTHTTLRTAKLERGSDNHRMIFLIGLIWGVRGT